MTAVKLRPSEASRDRVQVELRDSTSTSPDWSAVKRSFVDRPRNCTLLASLNRAAAIARQKSTSIPVQLPLSSGLEKPGIPWLTPHTTEPRCLTLFNVCAEAGSAAQNPATASTTISHFMIALPH